MFRDEQYCRAVSDNPQDFFVRRQIELAVIDPSESGLCPGYPERPADHGCDLLGLHPPGKRGWVDVELATAAGPLLSPSHSLGRNRYVADWHEG